MDITMPDVLLRLGFWLYTTSVLHFYRNERQASRRH